ncbi:MAG: hypothetical protein ACI4BI_04860 [Anaerotardibacter sp.]
MNATLTNKSKLLLFLTCCLAACLALVLAGCGGSKSSEPVKSTNGYISVSEYSGDGMKTFISSKQEMVSFATPSKSSSESPSSDKVIRFITVDDDGDMGITDVPKGITSFEEGKAYTKDMLSADLAAYQAENSNILKDLEEVTIGEYTYFASHMTINGEDAIQYVSVVDDKPVGITVVSADLLENEDVKKCIESVKWSFN